MRPTKKSSVLALACLALCGILPAHAADSVDANKVVVGGVPLEAAFDDKGGLWVTARQASGWGVKHVDLATKQIRTYTQSVEAAEGIVQGADGNMWFASRHGTIGRIANGTVTEFRPSYGRPWHITSGPDGALWFTLSEYENTSTQAGAIGRITTDGVMSIYPLDRNRSVGKITTGPDGALWATGPNTNEIVRITTQGAISYFATPVDIGDNAGIATGPDGNLWFSTGWLFNGQKAAVVRMDRNGNVLKVFSGAGIDAPMALVAGKDGNIWFSNATDGGTIGRIRMDGQVDEFVLPKGRLAGQWGMAYNAATGDLWTVEPQAGALERYPTKGYVLRLAMTGDRTLDETADATKNYAPTEGKKGEFIMGAPVGWPNDDPPIEAWKYNAPSELPLYHWHLRADAQPQAFALMNVNSGKCMVAVDVKNRERSCAGTDSQRFEAKATAVAGQFTLFNAALNKCSDFWLGHNYATVHPSGNFHGGHYRLGGSHIGMHECHAHYNQRFSFE
jgi:virginiamycin B lyase